MGSTSQDSLRIYEMSKERAALCHFPFRMTAHASYCPFCRLSRNFIAFLALKRQALCLLPDPGTLSIKCDSGLRAMYSSLDTSWHFCMLEIKIPHFIRSTEKCDSHYFCTSISNFLKQSWVPWQITVKTMTQAPFFFCHYQKPH